jgi:uncharacterized phosphosugar-binding protein
MLGAKYMDVAEKAISAIVDQLDTVKKAAKIVAQAAMSHKRVFVSDPYGVVESELADKSGNLAIFRSLQHSEERLGQGDVLILSTFLPSEERDLNIVTQAHSLGTSVITISPGGKLAESADLAITGSGVEMNGVLTCQGVEQPFGPISGIIHVLLLNMIQSETAAILLASGKTPSVLPGAYLEGGSEKRIDAERKFSQQGY